MVRDSSRPHELPVAAIHRRVCWSRVGMHGLILVLALVLVLAAPLAVYAQAQPPRSLRIVPTDLPDLEPKGVEDGVEVGIAKAPTTLNLIIDTDPGVDDAAALIWLFSQPQPLNVLGIVTVAGNTDVHSATNNALLLLSWLGKNNVTVVRGAEEPLEQIASKVNQLIHGPDGLWYLGFANPQNTRRVLTDAAKYYCDTLAKPNNRGATVLALGPLTNLAKAIDKCSTKWEGVRIVTLGGAKFGGNQTPVSEFNYWYDPEAADFVFSKSLAYGYQLEQVPEDAFDQFVLTGTDIALLYDTLNQAMANLLPAVTGYICALTQQCYYDVIDGFLIPRTESNGMPILHELDEFGQIILVGGQPVPVPTDQLRFPALPDPVAAIYTLDPTLGMSQPALVKILAKSVPEYVRGQSIIGLSFAEQLSMIIDDQELNNLIDLAFVDPFAFFYELVLIVSRDPNNATVVTDVAALVMIDRFLDDVTGPLAAVAGASVEIEGAEDTSGVAPGDANKLLLPMLGN